MAPIDGQTPGSTTEQKRARLALDRIAASLNCSSDYLMQMAHAETYPDENSELVRLWFKIQDPTVRRNLLIQIRDAAGEG